MHYTSFSLLTECMYMHHYIQQQMCSYVLHECCLTEAADISLH